VLFLIGASFIPPIDTSWLTQIGANVGCGSGLADRRRRSSRWGDFPRAGSGRGSPRWGTARPVKALENLFATGRTDDGDDGDRVRAAASVSPADGPRGSGPERGSKERESVSADPAPLLDPRGPGGDRPLVQPRARLLAAVPFVLSILLKLLGGRGCSRTSSARPADAWVSAACRSTARFVIGSTFSQNTFAYDGHGFCGVPRGAGEAGRRAQGEELVHAAAAMVLALGEMVSTGCTSVTGRRWIWRARWSAWWR